MNRYRPRQSIHRDKLNCRLQTSLSRIGNWMIVDCWVTLMMISRNRSDLAVNILGEAKKDYSRLVVGRSGWTMMGSEALNLARL